MWLQDLDERIQTTARKFKGWPENPGRGPGEGGIGLCTKSGWFNMESVSGPSVNDSATAESGVILVIQASTLTTPTASELCTGRKEEKKRTSRNEMQQRMFKPAQQSRIGTDREFTSPGAGAPSGHAQKDVRVK